MASITGGNGPDTLFGTEGDDTIAGGGGNDLIYGVAGDNTIHGGGGEDELRGGVGTDTIYGGDGDDVIYGDWRINQIPGHAPPDRFPAFSRDISNIVLYLRDGSGEIIKVKIEDFDGSYGNYRDPDDLPIDAFIAENYAGHELVAATVKAGRNFSGMGPGEG